MSKILFNCYKEKKKKTLITTLKMTSDGGKCRFVWFGLVWLGFYGISTIVGYLMPNPLYIYIY